MPSVQVKAKINYPPSAKKIGLEGVVVLSVLIDEKGAVRDASVLEGLTDDMDAEALRAIKEYKFSPARIEQDAVAVKVRYAIKFILENS
jgi:protein TonB